MIQENSDGVSIESTGPVTETKLKLIDAVRVGFAVKNADSSINVKVEISYDGGENWVDEGTTGSGTDFSFDNILTAAPLIRLNITSAGGVGDTADFAAVAKR